MKQINLNPEQQRRLVALMPLFCVALALILLYPASRRYNKIQDKISEQKKNLEELKLAAASNSAAPVPTAVSRDSEPSEFLGQITSLASASNCSLTELDSSPIDKPVENSVVTPLSAKVEIQGRYPEIRRFLMRLSQSTRFLVVTDISLAAANPGVEMDPTPSAKGNVLHAIIEIQRYTASATAPAS